MSPHGAIGHFWFSQRIANDAKIWAWCIAWMLEGAEASACLPQSIMCNGGTARAFLGSDSDDFHAKYPLA